MKTELRTAGFLERLPTMADNRAAVLAAFRRFGPATCDEIAAHIGWPVTSVRPRASELLNDFQRLEKTGERRAHQYVFKAVAVAQQLELLTA